jgi:hypothetical protein
MDGCILLLRGEKFGRILLERCCSKARRRKEHAGYHPDRQGNQHSRRRPAERHGGAHLANSQTLFFFILQSEEYLIGSMQIAADSREAAALEEENRRLREELEAMRLLLSGCAVFYSVSPRLLHTGMIARC